MRDYVVKKRFFAVKKNTSLFLCMLLVFGIIMGSNIFSKKCLAAGTVRH